MEKRIRHVEKEEKGETTSAPERFAVDKDLDQGETAMQDDDEACLVRSPQNAAMRSLLCSDV
ncbi:unnamed protein product [Fusarium graminearum]|nr:unnamed protein product [Fusarium graminearum]CZS82518.1 unnamed protein product [Fusarium graminearum]